MHFYLTCMFKLPWKLSPNLSLPALSAVIQTDRYCKILQTEQAERLGECFPRPTKGVTDPSITNIYSLAATLYSFHPFENFNLILYISFF